MITAVLPTYNNEKTIMKVIDDVLKYVDNVIVVNDGSTDSTHKLLSPRQDIILIEYPDGKNRGKGYALKMGLREASRMGYDYAISMDTDGQHFASDIPAFIDAIGKEPDSLIIGARNLHADGMPGKNTFANRFSNFWFKVETLHTLSDSQSGFRLYPLKRLEGMKFFTPRYEFEVEIIVRAAWRDIKVWNIPINVIYPEDRVSHFRPLRDFTRISILNTFLVAFAFIYYYPKVAWKWLKKELTRTDESNCRKAVAIGFGTMMSMMPVWGFQMVIALFFAHLFRLNKALVLAFSNISLPPVIPFILWGSLWTGGLILNQPTLISIDSLTIDSALQSFWQYVLGAIVFAPLCGGVVGLSSYLISRLIGRHDE
ncbi:MAG: DUF2062 domain-containing protein [Marinilabiliaceae bacterium]|nr:DUF2062 domain-containing protein [Marinilabiliaceae bacterium]